MLATHIAGSVFFIAWRSARPAEHVRFIHSLWSLCRLARALHHLQHYNVRLKLESEARQGRIIGGGSIFMREQ